jgi:vacuolar-type H+-ATPase subunit E/Vma4
MSKEGLIATLQEQTTREIEKYQQETVARIKELNDDFIRDREESLSKAKELGKQQAEKEKEQLLEALHTRVEHARQDLLWRVFHQIEAAVQEKLAGLRQQDAEYRDLFARLMAESITQIRKNNPSVSRIEVEVDSRDTTLSQSIQSEFEVETFSQLSTWGGMIMLDRKAGVMIDNRLEARLDRALPLFIRQWLSEIDNLLKDQE